MSKKATLVSVGDLILDIPQVDEIFDPSREILKSGDVVMGQVEIPYTTRPFWSAYDRYSAPATDPVRLEAMKNAGFNVGTCAGNHSFDQGYYGIVDTLDKLHELGIASCGEGKNLEEALAPAIVEKNGLKFACFSYTAVGPKTAMATPAKAGAAYLYVATAYDNDIWEPGALPTHIYTSTNPAQLEDMKARFQKAKDDGAFVIASYHMGRMHSLEIQQYQKEIAHAAIDAGAEMVIAHHPHTTLGMEIYKGKPIFYSIGHFIFATIAFQESAPLTAVQRKFTPFHYQGVNTEPIVKPREPIKDTIKYYVGDEASRNTMIVKGIFDENGLVETRIVPCFIDEGARPIPVRRGEKGDDVKAHFEGLIKYEELNVNLEWNEDGTELILSEK